MQKGLRKIKIGKRVDEEPLKRTGFETVTKTEKWETRLSECQTGASSV